MTDGDLLIFGCALSFFALEGSYLYLREAFTRGRASNESESDASAKQNSHVAVRS